MLLRYKPLLGSPGAFVAKEVERRSLMLETSTERGLVTACLSRNERKRLSNKRKQQGWLIGKRQDGSEEKD